MSVATTEWNRLNAMSMEDLEKQSSSLSDYIVGEYQVMVSLGDKGIMQNGSCKTTGLGADDKLNCYKDSKITIRKDNETLYTSRLMPLATSQKSGMGLPDWSKGVNLSHGKHIIENDGWLFCCVSISWQTNSNLYVNGQTITYVYTDGSNEYRSEDSVLIPVTKGDVVQTTGATPIVFKYYPLK